MQHSPAQDPTLIAGFYEAAAHLEQWQGAWAALCAAFDADTGLLYRQSRPTAQLRVLASRNWPQATHATRPLQPNVRSGMAAALASSASIRIVPQDEAGIALYATVPLDGTALVGMGLQRPAGARSFTDLDRRELDGIGRHVASALRLEDMLAAERRARGVRGAILDLYVHGIVVVTGRGSLVFANRSARRLADAAGVRLGCGRAGMGQIRSDEAVRLEELITSVAGGGPGGCTRISRGPGHPVLAAIVEPLPAGMAGEIATPSRGDAALVLITLRDLAATSDTAASHLMDLFGLTAAEAAIVPQLLCGESVSMIAQSRGVAVSTVKAQSGKVLAKTGAANLRALSTMIAALGCG